MKAKAPTRSRLTGPPSFVTLNELASTAYPLSTAVIMLNAGTGVRSGCVWCRRTPSASSDSSDRYIHRPVARHVTLVALDMKPVSSLKPYFFFVQATPLSPYLRQTKKLLAAAVADAAPEGGETG